LVYLAIWWMTDYRIQVSETQKPSLAAGFFNLWCPDPESNQGHADFQSAALPTELSGQRGALNRKALVTSTTLSLSWRVWLNYVRCGGAIGCAPGEKLSPSRRFGSGLTRDRIMNLLTFYSLFFARRAVSPTMR
jgi:hypothetical protein